MFVAEIKIIIIVSWALIWLQGKSWWVGKSPHPWVWLELDWKLWKKDWWPKADGMSRTEKQLTRLIIALTMWARVTRDAKEQ
jgi:hypothetical protein